jgi:hypothetical protein
MKSHFTGEVCPIKARKPSKYVEACQKNPKPVDVEKIKHKMRK